MTLQLAGVGKSAAGAAVFWDISEKGEMSFWAKINWVLRYFQTEMLLKQEKYQNIWYQHHQNILDLRWRERAQMEIDTLWKVTTIWMINEVTL